MHEEMHMTQMQFMNTGAREIVSFLDTTSGAMLPKRCIQEGNNFSGSRIRKLHLCHMHFFMHSSIPPMIDVGVLIRTRFYFTLVKHGIKSKAFA